MIESKKAKRKKFENETANNEEAIGECPKEEKDCQNCKRKYCPEEE
jgi:hypothetical protein